MQKAKQRRLDGTMDGRSKSKWKSLILQQILIKFRTKLNSHKAYIRISISTSLDMKTTDTPESKSFKILGWEIKCKHKKESGDKLRPDSNSIAKGGRLMSEKWLKKWNYRRNLNQIMMEWMMESQWDRGMKKTGRNTKNNELTLMKTWTKTFSVSCSHASDFLCILSQDVF